MFAVFSTPTCSSLSVSSRRQGRSTLLLGPPSCGKTTLMRVLAARLRGCSALKVDGEVLYNGYSKDEFAVERVAAFVGQVSTAAACGAAGAPFSAAHNAPACCCSRNSIGALPSLPQAP